MTDETRVVLINPGDVLLIGGCDADANSAEVFEQFRKATGIRAVAVFAGDISIDKLTAEQLDQLKRATNPAA